ncbi:MAG: MBL fold metallo-hydrolase [Bacteroidota bacterium]
MKLTFYGAAQQVTGSMHLLTLDNGYNILLDCGMNYEQKRELNAASFEFPFNPADIDVVILSHAHIDHSGNIPKLVADGFRGNILCTPPTYDLVNYLLHDSANIQLNEYKQRLSRATKHRRTLIAPPIYSDKQVDKALEQVVTLPFNKSFVLNENVHIEFTEAGHLLGAACTTLTVNENGKTTRIGFTGDLGRSHAELIRVPLPMKQLDYLITETTYGGRKHKSSAHAEDELARYIDESLRIRGRLIIPAFSVGRTQSILFVIHKLFRKGLLPPVKVFIDSPLAVRSTRVYEKYPELLNSEAREFLTANGNLFDFDELELIEDYDDHERVLLYTDSCIIISAAGMVEGGRIQEHVKNNIQNPFSTILIAGYCAEGTLGYRLLQWQQTIGIKGRDYRVYSKIAQTDVFSSHPDKDEIFNYIKSCYHPGLKKIFLVHGDGNNLNDMQHMLAENGIENAVIPELYDSYQLT